MIRLLLVLALICSSLTIIAQDSWVSGYVVMVSGDTLQGELLNLDQNNPATMQFRSNRQSKVETYLPSNISIASYHNGHTYKSVPANKLITEARFYKVLAEGRAILFAVDGRFILCMHDTSFYELRSELKKELVNGVTVTREVYPFRGILNYLFFDCDKVKVDIQTAIPSVENLQSLVNKYNSCFGSVKEIKKTKKSSFTFGIQGGLTSRTDRHVTNVSGISFLEQDNIKTSQSIFLGISASCAFNDKFAVSLDIYSYKSNAEGDLISTSEDNSIDYSSSCVQVSVLPIYSFRKQGIVPYIFLGPTVVNYSKQTSTRDRTIKFSTPGVTIEENYTNFYTAQAAFGFLTGVGIKYKTNFRIQPFLECEASKIVSVVNVKTAGGGTARANSHQSGLYFGGGILVKL